MFPQQIYIFFKKYKITVDFLKELPLRKNKIRILSTDIKKPR